MIKLIGYACHNTTLGTSASRTARLRNVTDARLRELIAANLADLKKIIKWNIDRDIRFYRIASGLIPYATHPVNGISWRDEFARDFAAAGRLIDGAGMVVGMHPGQYTVLSSPAPEVVDNSLKEIEYHSEVLDLLGRGSESKITVHLGGAYGDKNAAVKRWQNNFAGLSETAKQRILIENDGISGYYTDCLRIHEDTGVPIAFDVFHYGLESGSGNMPDSLRSAIGTWAEQSAVPIVHYSDQAPGKNRGAHADRVDPEAFMDFYRRTQEYDFNIMLESKDKELSVLKVREKLGRL